MSSPAPAEATFGIAQVAQHSGLTQDTLRWYEREGLLPPVERGIDGRRTYTERDLSMVIMLATLRDSGMPIEDMRAFSTYVSAGASTHGRRVALLEHHRTRILDRIDQVQHALAVLDQKSQHYRELIDAGLDCDGLPVPLDVAALQRKREL